MLRSIPKLAKSHADAALDLFHTGKIWDEVNTYHLLTYKESEASKKLKILSIKLNAGTFFGPEDYRKIPYLRYYYDNDDDDTRENISRIHDMITEQYRHGNLKFNLRRPDPIDWTTHCVPNENRMVRLTTLNLKYKDYSINELKLLIRIDQNLKLVRQDGHYYVKGLRFKRARCLNAPS